MLQVVVLGLLETTQQCCLHSNLQRSGCIWKVSRWSEAVVTRSSRFFEMKLHGLLAKEDRKKRGET